MSHFIKIPGERVNSAKTKIKFYQQFLIIVHKMFKKLKKKILKKKFLNPKYV
jgi:hypothetical protein